MDGDLPMSNSKANEDLLYRNVIDRLVDDCHSGQGQIAANSVRSGVWHTNATPEFLPEEHEVNALIARLSPAEREMIARMLARQFVGGVHAALVALHEAEIAPFDKAYEGTPFHDFVGRLDDWMWPGPDTERW